MKYFVVPTVICGVKLFAVEESDGYVLKYCDTKERAESFIKELENELWLLEKHINLNAHQSF